MEFMEIRNKTVLITGGRRVGRSVAGLLARHGANLVITYNRSREEAEKTAEEAAKSGVKAQAVEADLTRMQDVKRVIDAALDAFGRLDALVHMASTFRRIEFKDLTESDWNEEIANNLTSAFLAGKAAADAILRSGGGKIIFITDWAINRPYRNYLPYLVAKGGVHTLALTLAKELAPTIQVNTIAPGPVLFPDDFPADVKEREIAKTLLKREGSPDDIAKAVLFLLKDADFTTGSSISVDGGKLMF